MTALPAFRYRQARVLALVTALVALSAADATAQTASIFGRNLVVNGGAEAGPGTSDTGQPPMPPPGWKTIGNFTVAQYGGSGGLPGKTDPGPANRGVNFFSGGKDNPASSARQKIDLGAGADAIDGGATRYRLSAFLGGFAGQEDHAAITAKFESASGETLGVATLGPVTAVDRKNLTGLVARVASGSVPAKTRQVEIVIDAKRFEGAYNDAYSDNIALILAP
jgi:hypothetical protein